ncbi:MAG: hypothetical protein JL50_08355 [Peptococcaceae bacterium BICA1-7]|nr:MAG: hypothetical protein JL50_08355 [Peptococcaceae bacterium BICA1-7]HBV97426.1 phage Gp37/Gp68 family protein [Desulfotomaculum sp.]
MADKSKINWTEATWNPVTGCSKVSEGCRYCYAEREWPRLAGNPKSVYFGRKFTDVQCHQERFEQPLRWAKPRLIFVNSMSDLFHEAISMEFLDEVFAVILACAVLENRSHIFQVLTKRPKRMFEYFSSRTPIEHLKAWAKAGNWIHLKDPDVCIDEYVSQFATYTPYKNGKYTESYQEWNAPEKLWPLKNLWLGVTAEDQRAADERIPILLQIPAAIRFVSVEPMLGSIRLDKQFTKLTKEGKPAYPCDENYLFDLDWVICGGESGPSARPMHPDWLRNLKNQCMVAGVPFFFKQWGEWKSFYDRDIDDPDWQNVPEEKHGVCRLNLAGGHGFHGERVVYCRRAGKKAAGRLLDGREWSEMPRI